LHVINPKSSTPIKILAILEFYRIPDIHPYHAFRSSKIPEVLDAQRRILKKSSFIYESKSPQKVQKKWDSGTGSDHDKPDSLRIDSLSVTSLRFAKKFSPHDTAEIKRLPTGCVRKLSAEC
jgi:hypothetical protein